MDHIAYKKIEDFFHKFGTCYTFKVMTLEIKVFGKIEVFDGLYNCLLCIVIVFFFSKYITYSKEFFSWPKLNGGVQKGWS
jgi:hypothetical protein